ncbi:hypothetical protein AMECASPLE_018587 [Ameca splendens]|uniref:Uncharacterized protein n=1 Tax=Ameca splendens TaxID=208324 RepID=A0ABV0YPN1_9TELE
MPPNMWVPGSSHQLTGIPQWEPGNMPYETLPHYEGRLVLRVCLRGGGRQEVPLLGCPGRDATGAHCTSCVGPNGSISINPEIQEAGLI